MQPQDPYQQPQPPVQPPVVAPLQGLPQQHAPAPANYDFIMNPSKPQKPKLFTGGGMVGRILLVLGGLFVLAIIAAVVSSALGGGSKFDKTAILGIAQDQTQLLHLTQSGSTNSGTEINKNLTITTQLSVTSQQKDLLTYAATRGLKPKPATLALKQSADIDTQLMSAESSSTFDVTYTQVLQAALQTYQSDLKAAYADAGVKGKPILKSSYDAVTLLLVQLDTKQ